MSVVCVGDCGVDHYLPSGPVLCGGITANFALHARAAFPENDKIAIISAVGNDDAANVVRDRLKDSGIDCHIASLEGASSVQYIEIESNGEKNFVRYDEGVLRDYLIDKAEQRLIASSDLLVVPAFRQIRRFFEAVISMKNAGLTAIDFADFAEHPDFALIEKQIDAIDIGFFGLTVEHHVLIEEIRRLAAAHDKVFVVTLGADGSRAFRGQDSYSCPAEPVDAVVDTTGAGDAFAAGFLSQYCYGASVHESLSKGASLAAKTIQRLGAN
jgi:fructoselysine 6-kinase